MGKDKTANESQEGGMTFSQVVSNFLNNTKSPNYEELAKPVIPNLFECIPLLAH